MYFIITITGTIFWKQSDMLFTILSKKIRFPLSLTLLVPSFLVAAHYSYPFVLSVKSACCQHKFLRQSL